MNTTKQSRWILAVLSTWLAVTPLAQAFYNPNTGRWLNRDPIEESGGLNVFETVANDALSYIDTLALCPELVVNQKPTTTTDLPTKEKCKEVCGADKDQAGNITRIVPACTKHSFDPSLACVCCANKKWYIKAVIKYQCKIQIAGASLPVNWTPSRNQGLKHEQCHCDDGKKAADDIIAEIAAIGAFGSKSDCEAKLKLLDPKARFDQLMQPSEKHQLSKYQAGGSCFAEASLAP